MPNAEEMNEIFPEKPVGKNSAIPFLLRMGWLGLLVLVVLFSLYPVHSRLIGVILTGGIFVLSAGAVRRVWRNRVWRGVILMAGIIAGFLILGPGRGYDVSRLRDRYIRVIQSYEGTRYVWGGENRIGIDCSGLVRRGLIEANVLEGLVTWNPGRIRAAWEIWGHDCSAKSLREGYRGWTEERFAAAGINGIRAEQMEAGDIAVTSDGVHVMVYIGNGEWMEADPGLGRVFRGRAPVENGWFEKPVQVLRWRQLLHRDKMFKRSG
jgi:hypothetical protein